MSAKQSVATRRKIIDLPSDEAREFFFKGESYLRVELPAYFKFDGLLNEVAQKLNPDFSFEKHCRNAMRFEDVNYTILDNRDGRYSWRPYELIHPVLYVSLVNQITEEASWLQIVERFNEFDVCPQISCLSLPVRSSTSEADKAEQIRHWWENIEQESIALSLDFKFVIHTDIVDCYPSIYTHSIPWALHSKEIAKAQRRCMTLIGNVIDLHIRAMRYGQTNGIPQGSVLADFIAEMVLGYADSMLSKKIKCEGIEDYRILRYRDDYRIFVNSSRDGERILRCLTEVMIELGLRLKPEKTKTSSDVIRSSIKDDKLEWLLRKTDDQELHKQLLIIHDQDMKYPNCGSVRSALDEFDKKLEKDEELDNPFPLIGIVVDIALRSPRNYPVSAAILSKLIDYIESEDERRITASRIKERFSALPNTGHMEIWIQRFSEGFASDLQFSEPLCRLVRNEPESIWNSDWLAHSPFDWLIDPTKVINREEHKRVGSVIPNKEVRIFDWTYFW